MLINNNFVEERPAGLPHADKQSFLSHLRMATWYVNVCNVHFRTCSPFHGPASCSEPRYIPQDFGPRVANHHDEKRPMTMP